MIKLDQKSKSTIEGNKNPLISFGINMVKVLSLSVFMITLLSVSNLFAAGTTYYSKSGSTDPNAKASWNSNRDGTSGSAPSNFTTSNNVFVIQNGNSMTTTGTWTISGTSTKLWIENGGSLQGDHAINLATVTTFQIDNSGIYIHNNTTDPTTNIFNGTESFASGSIFKIYNWNSNTNPVNTSVTLPFGNLIIKWTSNTSNWQQNFSGTVNLCQNDLTIDSTGRGTLRFTSSTNTPTITVGGNFSLNLGTVDFTSGTGSATINLGGTFSQSGGSMTASGTGFGIINTTATSATWSFTGGTRSDIKYIVPTGKTVTLGSDFNIGSGTLSSVTDMLSVTGTLNAVSYMISAGALNHNIAIGASGKIITTNANGFSGSATTTVSNTNSLAVSYNATSIVEYGSNSSENVTSGSFNNITFSGTGTKTLLGNLTVSGTLTMTNGVINTGSYTMTLGTSTSSLGTLTYTSGKIIGSFKRWFGTATVNNVQFPVGTASQSRMVALSRTNVTTGGSLTAKFVASDPGNNNSSYLTDNTYTVDRFTNQGYWEITKNTADGTFAGNYSLDMETNGFSGILDITKLRIIKRPDAVSAWVLEGTHTNGVGTTVKRTGLSNFSQFTLGGNATDNPLSDSPLPVSLSSFTSSVKNNSVTLNWSTVSEINNKGFEIERKESNSSNYTKVGFVDGKGTTNQVSNYSFADNKLNSGNYSYRIKQVDFNGNFEYFSLNSGIEIGAPKKFTLAQNYPNPFNPSTKIDYEIPSDSKVNITIYDISGKEVQQVVNEYQKAGYYTAQFNASRLSSGTYFYKLTSGIDILTKKMTLIK